MRNQLLLALTLGLGYGLGCRRARRAGPIDQICIEVKADAAEAIATLKELERRTVRLTLAGKDLMDALKVDTPREAITHQVIFDLPACGRIKTNETKLAAAFTEWERRFREEPDRFQAESERLAGSPETYGSACAAYISQILTEQAAA